VTIDRIMAGPARRRFAGIALEHALRASAAQQLRALAAGRADTVGGRQAAAREQAIAARLEARVAACRAAAAADGRVERTDELAARRATRHRVARSA
jgi:hypothetical protein